jgi:hypothetical protein
MKLERFQSKMLFILTDAPCFVPNAVIIGDLQVLSVTQEVRNYSFTYRQRLDGHPNSLAKTYFKGLFTVVGLSGITLPI